MLGGLEGDLSNLNSEENIEWIKKVIKGEIKSESINKDQLNDEQADYLKQLKNLRTNKGYVWKIVKNEKEETAQLVIPEKDREKKMELNHASILSGHFKFG